MRREAKIGLFVLIGLAVMVFFILRTEDLSKLLGGDKKRGRRVSVHLEDASGIREGTPVKIAGIKVGEVVDIHLKDGKAVAVITVPSEMQFKEGALARLKTQGVLGDQYISLDQGLGGLSADQDQLLGIAPPSLGDLTGTINELGRNMLTITENIKQGTVTPSGNNRIEAITANLEKLTDVLVSIVEENRNSLKLTGQQVSELSGQLNREVPALVAELTELVKGLKELTAGNSGNLNRTMEDMTVVSKNMADATSSLRSVASKVDEGQGSIGRLINEGDSVDKLNSVLDQAKESLVEVKNLLKKADDIKLDLRFSSEYLTSHGAPKNYFGFKIQPSEHKYYLLEGVSRETDYLPLMVRQTTEETFDAVGNLISTTIRTETREVDDLVFNGLLAYRFGNMFLKAGVIESEGGAGLDFIGLKDRLLLSLEGYDFGRNDLSPHGKLGLSYSVGEHIRFRAGWDDFLEEDFRSAYIGAGIRWTDDDLKILLTNVGKFF